MKKKKLVAPFKSKKPKVQKIKLQCGIEVTLNWSARKKCECGETIWFGRTNKGRWMPINLVGLAEWDTHYADCPLADKFRQKNRRKGAKTK